MAKKQTSMEALKGKLNDAKERIVDLEQRFEGTVSEHPLQSIGVAFGIGFVAGAVVVALARRK